MCFFFTHADFSLIMKTVTKAYMYSYTEKSETFHHQYFFFSQAMSFSFTAVNQKLKETSCILLCKSIYMISYLFTLNISTDIPEQTV